MDDLEACAAADVPVDEVLEWRKEPRFVEYVQICLEDKRTSFRGLTSNLLPHTARVLYTLLTSDNPKDQAKGAAMMLRAQGQFLDVTQVQDADAMSRLLDKLRQPQEVQILNVEPRP